MKNRPVVWDVGVGLAVAVLMVLICHGARMQIGFIDPWLYTGLIYGFKDLAEEFGVLYYSQRVGFLLPAIAFHELFGLQAGYLLLRVVMVTGLVLALARVARVFMGAGWARCLAVVAVLHPWAWRSLFWNYVDGMAMVYTGATFACVVSLTAALSARGRVGWGAASGVALALAGGTNLFSLVVAGFAGIWPLAWFVGRRRWWDLLRAGGAAAAGFGLAYGALVVGRYLLVPSQGWQWDVLALTTGRDLASGGGAAWHESVWGLVADGWVYLLIPALVLGAVSVAAWMTPRERREPLVLAAVILAATGGLYLVTDFGLKAAVISLFFYFVHLLPATFLATAAVVGAILTRDARGRDSTRWLLGLAVVAVGLYLARESVAAGAKLVSPWMVMVAFGGMAVIGMALRRRLGATGLASGMVVLMMLSATLFYGANDAYTPISREESVVEAEALQLGLELRGVIGEGPPTGGKLAFWYANETPDAAANFFDAMNGVWYWGYSRLHGWSEDRPPGMPVLTEEEEERLPWFLEIAILAWNREDAEQGLRRLREAGWTASAEFHEFHSEHIDFVMATVRSPEFDERLEAAAAQVEREENQRLRGERQAARKAKQAAKAAAKAEKAEAAD